MDDSAIAHINLGRTHQPLADIAMPGGQAADQHQIAQDVDIAGHRLPAEGERRGKLRLVEHTALHMGQPGPLATQRGGGNARAQRRDVPLQIRGSRRRTSAGWPHCQAAAMTRENRRAPRAG